MTAAEDFKAALMGLRQAAGSTFYKTLVSYARGQRVSLTSSSLSDWFTGKSIPSDAAALRVVVTCLASRANMSPAQRAECCSQLERLREAAWKERHLLPVPAPPPLRGDLFAAGSGVGSKIIMAPLFGSPFDPASLLEQFIDSLLAVGLDEGNVAPFRAVVDGFLLATSRDEAADLLDAYNSAMWNVDTLVREHCAAGEFTWFALGQMLFQIAYQGTYAGTSPGGDRGLSDQRDTLFHLADSLELPATLRSELQRFARMPVESAMDGHLVEEARRLARVIRTFLVI
ncbi:hypothetical protein [Streptomyces sioyaensis]|uniref:hypothetical protein n=1 Tax=Streptomyces sioyaensis TaxID=67364 RepID=UPI0036E586C0